MADARKKIAILGGGIGGLATAFEITSQAGWADKYEVTLHTLGHRLGGKCASSRGPNGRIEEHGIHGFLGSYYNTLPMMAACFTELAKLRAPGTPLSTFDTAFTKMDSVQMWEWVGTELQRWPIKFPRNSFSAIEPQRFLTIEDGILSLIRFLSGAHRDHKEAAPEMGLHLEVVTALFDEALGKLEAVVTLGPDHPLLGTIDKAWLWLRGKVDDALMQNTTLRRIFIFVDYVLALLRGALADDVIDKGFDQLDDEDWVAWLRRHKAHEITITSPLALNTINLSYQYERGDSTLTPTMAAGAYLHWTLRSFAYCDRAVFAFAAGTGEIIIAPLYEVLKARGVKFEFFHKVEALRLSGDKKTVAAVDITVQATLKDPAVGYQPLFAVKDLPCWPARPLYEQLVQGDALRVGDYDLESWWTAWDPKLPTLTLEAGRDYDHLVLAISIGAFPHIAPELAGASTRWQDMVANIPTIQTQQVQIWLSKSYTDLGWDLPFDGMDTVVADTYINPLDGQVEFRHIIPWEDWPVDNTPKSLWYFCGVMSNWEPDPPFSDHDFPRRMHERVHNNGVQYMHSAIGPLMPKATTDAVNPPGDPVGLDFSLLVDTENPDARGIARFKSQFWRANIDPTERYVTAPPGSTKYRLRAWDTDFDNLVIAGDWAYTGINVGSVEGTVMSGKLASYAITGAPALSTIIGYYGADGKPGDR